MHKSPAALLTASQFMKQSPLTNAQLSVSGFYSVSLPEDLWRCNQAWTVKNTRAHFLRVEDGKGFYYHKTELQTLDTVTEFRHMNPHQSLTY